MSGRSNRELRSLEGSPRSVASGISRQSSEIDLDSSDIDFLTDADEEKDIVRTKVTISVVLLLLDIVLFFQKCFYAY